MSNKPDMERVIQVLISLLEEQEQVEITYTIEKEEDKTAQAVEGRTSMKRRGPRTKWQRIVREVVFELLIGAAIGLAFDAMLFIWLLVR